MGKEKREELIQRLLDEVDDPKSLLAEDGLLKQLKKAAMERILEGEMTHHLGYEKHDPAGLRVGMLSSCSAEYSEVVLPDPVGPVTSTMP